MSAIIEVALNGVTPHAPRTPAEITADALACIAAGASIVHNHNDEPMWVDDGVHASEPYAEAWRPILAAHPDVQLYTTQASGGPGIAIETRWAHQEALARAGLLRVGLIDPGSVNLGDRVYVNTLPDARFAVARCAALGLTASVSIFDPSFLRAALALPLPAGAIIKLYFGGEALPFGLPPTEPSLDAYLAMLDGAGRQWLVAVLGGDVVGCGLAALALARGGHVRVGLEDYAGPRSPSNVELVREAAALIAASGRRVATPAETRALLG
ncbi:3-keto-5-aminohexanoate cleavage protein [Solirubrobacter soli]|uniref:3-keto-5-aminohexanoate cleavage protein n=1 Tax=Solirubrobacter soli TaxID=363832 RepID=UPI00041B2748|nr:3-keto-5-aminohexanoate cleavage protein [Solirubrobacter soli]